MSYLLLVVSKHQVRLYRVQGDVALPLSPDGLPDSLDDAWAGMERQEKSVQFHSTSGSGGHPAFHGQGGAKDVESQEAERFMHMVIKSLQPLLHDEQLPLVFAGVEHAFGLLRKFDDTDMIASEYIHGNHDHDSVEELLPQASTIARAWTLEKNAPLAETYGNHLGTGLATQDVAEVLRQAHAGKVELLLLSVDEQCMGSFDPDTGSCAIGSDVEHAQDLQTLAAEHTHAHRGRVAWMAPEHMPEGASMAAVLRH